MSSPWTTPEQLIATLRRRWDSGRYAAAYAAGIPWTPLSLSVRAPSATELLERFDDVLRWVERFRRASVTAGGAPRFRVEHRTIRGKNVGSNEVPARIWIDTFEQLCSLLGTSRDVQALDAIMKQTQTLVPGLLPWVIGHPLSAVAHRGIWDEVLATVAWIAAHDTTQLYLRHIDVEGVDTKFVERHHNLLDDLLSDVLPPWRVDDAFSRADFTRRFRFRAKPDYVRLRLLGPVPGFRPPFSELRVRADELAAHDLGVGRVFVIENEITYLAFPPVADAIAVFGAGYSLEVLKSLPWLDSKEIVYWGDIDTHGFAILNNLRSRFDRVRSILMDHETLLAHPRQWVIEPVPTNRPLPHLYEPEAALYRDLIEDRFGPSVRLEQERVRFSLVRRALWPWAS